jgi:hypothetical protein
LRDTAQATSILALIGQGCHRISEIAARMGKPVTSLARPLERLIEMDLVVRETPFGTSVRRLADSVNRAGPKFSAISRQVAMNGSVGPSFTTLCTSCIMFLLHSSESPFDTTRWMRPSQELSSHSREGSQVAASHTSKE